MKLGIYGLEILNSFQEVLIIDQPNLDIFTPQDLNTFWKRINGMIKHDLIRIKFECMLKREDWYE